MNTVKKGANRATAAARTNRHAQRTPLPPRPGDVAAAKDVIAESGAILAAVTEEAARHNPMNPGGVVVADLLDKAASSNGEAPDARSQGKAQEFAAVAATAGWKAAPAARGTGVEVVATRGAETIVQEWRGGVWQYEASFYAFGDRTTKPRNASGAKKLLGRTGEDAAAEASKVSANKSFRKAEPRDLAKTLADARLSLPFSLDDSDDAVLKAVQGHSIEWYNRLSRKAEDGIVGTGQQLRIVETDSGRVLMFCCPRNGFRSCLLSAVLSVGGYVVKESVDA